MSIQGIEGVLQQMQATALQAGMKQPAEPLQETGFASEMKAALGKISDTQNTAQVQSEKLELGVPGVGLNDVMVDMQKSAISLQLGVQVRNKLVSAYSEIMNMSV
ncbi:flagellar hook-basal body complex protein FliE [Rahnella sp. SAP-1]|jgi:flagellar hook-basal body complex protein FliE|uniref:Flagellar hook-basal body complex protein FliE n=1 Tax=Rouxiella aceris TaxID=2703884 RepID=A0A848MPR9_9GAMM|nr:flagellar hook-basal body complex protein FliE [Rouxiella aceris]NMP28094.1 flagellar hook-basal body complex protein FliE [Rouxiella aceris]